METGCIYEANPLKHGASGRVGMTGDLNLSWHLYWLLQCFSDVCLLFSHCSTPQRLDWHISTYYYSPHLFFVFFFQAAIEGKNKYKNKCYFLLWWGFPFFHFTAGRKKKKEKEKRKSVQIILIHNWRFLQALYLLLSLFPLSWICDETRRERISHQFLGKLIRIWLLL